MASGERNTETTTGMPGNTSREGEEEQPTSSLKYPLEDVLQGLDITDVHSVRTDIWYNTPTIGETSEIALTTYTLRCIRMYEDINVVDDELFGTFQEDFAQWTLEMFDAIYIAMKRALKKCLRRRGVWTGFNNKALGKGFVDLLNATELPLWNETELDKQILHPTSQARLLLARHLKRQVTGMTTSQLSTLHRDLSIFKPKNVHWEELEMEDHDRSVKKEKYHDVPPEIRRSASRIGTKTPDSYQRASTGTPTATKQEQYVDEIKLTTNSSDREIQRIRAFLDIPEPIPAYLQSEFQRTVKQPQTKDDYYQVPPLEFPNEEIDGHQLSQFNKIYSGGKFDGEPYNLLDTKVRRMIKSCKQLGIAPTQFSAVFPSILSGKANDYYSDYVDENDSFRTTYFKIKTRFESEQSHARYESDWRTLNYRDMCAANPEKKPQEILADLFDKLDLCKQALPNTDDYQLRTMLQRATDGSREFRDAFIRPATTSGGMKEDLRRSLANYIKFDASSHNMLQEHETLLQQQNYDESSDQYYLDRQYTGNHSRGGRPHHQSRGRFFYRSIGRGRGYHRGNHCGSHQGGRGGPFRPRSRKCFVCGKTGCWSWNHTDEERDSAKKTFLQWTNEDEPDDSLLLFITDFEGEESADKWYERDSGIDDKKGDKMVTYLNTQSFLHRQTQEDIYSPLLDTADDQAADQFLLDRYSSEVFQGILIDTGAAGRSTAGKAQFLALKKARPEVTLDESRAGEASVRFGFGDDIHSIGTTTLSTPIGEITFHVLNTPTPFLLCLADMSRLGVFYNNITDQIVGKGVTVPVTRKWGHGWFYLNEEEAATVFLSESELRRIHRRFGHPTVARLHKLLTCAGHDVDRKALEAITKFCHHCQVHDQSLRRFKFALKDECNFNYEIYVDIVHINGRDVLHVVDSATNFQGARFLPSRSTKDTWEQLRLLWIDTYQGPPDVISYDAGTNFSSTEFRSEAKIMGITCNQAPTEAHWTIGKIERSHGPLRRAFEVIHADLKGITSDEAILQMAVKALNDTAGPDGLVPTLLVFGSYPRIHFDSPPSPNTIKRAEAARKAMKELQRLRAERMVREAAAQRNGPRTIDVLTLPLQSEVLVYRENDGWKGPFKVASIDGHDVTVDTVNGPVKIRSTQVKPYHRDNGDTSTVNPPGDTIPVVPDAQPRRRGRPRGSRNKPKTHASNNVEYNDTADDGLQEENGDEPLNTFLSQKEADDAARAIELRNKGIITTPGCPFEESDQKEIDDLVAGGVFEFTVFNPELHANIRIFNTRMVREVKGKGINERPYEKSRLVIQGHHDDGKHSILTQSPTIQRSSQRTLLTLIPVLESTKQMTVALRDISQAYTQSKSRLFRPIFAYLPPEMKPKYPPNTILHVVKPLYGLAEAGVHWFSTYHAHHVNELSMQTSTYDPCLLISEGEKQSQGIVAIQTDDTLILANKTFHEIEEAKLRDAKFKAKPKAFLSATSPLDFNGMHISQEDKSVLIQPKRQGDKLAIVDKHAENMAQQYIQQRARGAYLASTCQPEASYDLSVAAQHSIPQESDCDTLNRRIQWQIQNKDRGLRYIPVDLSTASIYVFTDGSFANNRDLTSQLGYVIVIANEVSSNDSHFAIRGNVLHWSSTKSKRVTRSVLASEIYGMTSGFDIAFSITTTINMIMERFGLPDLPLVVCTDSFSLYQCLVKLGTTRERRLMIDLMYLRQSYERREIVDIRWVNGEDNVADAMTKASPNKALKQLIETNELTIRVEGRVRRSNGC